MSIHEDRARAGSFGDDAERYDRSRPTYPSELVEDLLAEGAGDVLDVGAGTGIVSALFVARGCRVLALEPDPRMAALAAGKGIDVVVSTFEEWDSAGRRFDLVVSGQAWHWVDPERGYPKVAALLRPGATFAGLWNRYRHEPAVLAALEAVYERHAPQLIPWSMALGNIHHPGDDPFEATAALVAKERRAYEWHRVRTTAQWLDELPTHSDHRLLPPEVLAAIERESAAVVDRNGGVITMTVITSALIGRVAA